jgi:chromate transporter
MLIVWLLAALYVRSQTIPQVDWLLYGVKPVIVAIVLQALWKLGRSAIKDYRTAIAAMAVIGLYFLGINELLLLLLAGGLVMLSQQAGRTAAGWLLPTAIATAGGAPSAATEANWLSVFLIFLKIGSVLYGSGYVLLAFLQRELVERMQWLTSQQLLDAIAIGQLTPGPVFTTATFIGYLLAGHAGAIAATIGIFLPAFVLVGVVNPWVPKLRQSRWLSSFLNGVNAASLGLMAAVTWQLGLAALIDWLTVIVAIVSAIAVFRFRVNSAWLVLAGAIVGLVARGIGG